VLSYGEWPSPVTAESLVAGAAGISEVIADPVQPWLLWWAESRPDEGGRTAVMRCDLRGGEAVEATPAGSNVRTRVHEYGGGAWWPHDGSLFYVEFADQRLRRLDTPGAEPVLLTGEPPEPRARRYADGRVTPDGRWCVCVRELHDTGVEPVNELAAVAADGSDRVVSLWSGADFVMTPRVSPDGSMLAWISWNHPDMPWDTTCLRVHRLNGGQLGDEVLIVGRDNDRSLCEPGWDTTEPARLLVCSDHDDWWGLYEVDLEGGSLSPVITGAFDVATPPWVFGMQRWAAASGMVAAVAGMPSGDEFAGVGDGVEVADSSIDSLTVARVSPHGDPVLAYAGAGFRHETEVVALIPGDRGGHERRVVRPARDLGLDRGLLVEPEAIAFPTGPDGATTAHALYYRPANPACAGPPGELPPLLVHAHGGPTAAARRQLSLGITYWTSRGIAVVDVDYRGSTGYGRRYRQALDGAWGIVDVEDCVAAAQFLAGRGDVDPQRLLIRGGSAGGFTVLAALALHDVFAAGSSRYGVADLEALAADTHKFESRYLDRLIGPYPEARDTYLARSPINHLDGFDAPMIVLQGDEDEIVPPSQSEMIVDALKVKGVPVAYMLFKGEQHGFRAAENIIAALEAELGFFGRVLGFTPADDLPPLEISGL
jgi:dipeptidyl aminopeptidase/acylaminoacyl peptidase